MKVSVKNIIVLLVIFFVILGGLALSLFLYIKYTRVVVTSDMITEYEATFSHNLSSDYHYRQSGNDCGPLNVAAVLRLRDIQVDNQEIIDSTKFRFRNDYTHPWGIEDHFMFSFSYDTSELNDEEKINFLKSKISSRHAGILLGGTDTYQHYITLLGYGDDEFYVYDSLHTKGVDGLTVDSNGSTVGNRSLSNEELLDFWSKGGMYGFYEDYVMFVYSGPK